MTQTAKLNDILIENFNSKIEKKNKEAFPFIESIEKDGKLLNDFISPLGQDSQILFHSNGSVKMQYLQDHKNYSLHPHAIRQIGEKLGVNSTYIKDLALSNDDWKRNLISYTLNEFSENSKRQRVLVREINGEIRGVLSDQYRRLNTSLIFESFIQSTKNEGAIIVDAFTDGIKSFIEVLRPDLIEIPFKGNGSTVVGFGMRISNSDFGAAALDVRAFMIQAVCINGLVTNSMVREIHLGKRLPDNLKLSEQTYLYDTQTQASLVRDIVKGTFTRDAIMEKGKLIQDAEFYEVDLEKELKHLNRAGQITKTEREAIEKVFVNNNPNDGVDGRPSLWKLSQGIGTVARDSENKLRKRELEEISGVLLKRASE